MRALSILALAALFACATAGTSTDTAADEQAIRGVIDAWDLALSSQNDSLLATYYTEDGELMPPATLRIRGRVAIRAFWAGLWPLKPTLTMTPTAIHVTGDWAIEEGDWNWSSLGPAGEQRDHGKYLRTWRRTDTSWQTAQDIWNSDQVPFASTEK